jgi:hypothetical protein
LGDGGGPASLIARDADRFRCSTEEMRAIVDAWFREEAEHARLLGRAVDRLGGRHIKSHWSFTAFCLCRRVLGVRFELQVLLLTELVSTAYYRVLCAHSPDAPVAEMCRLILRDEAGHAAATMLWVNHGPGLTAIGGSRSEYFAEVRRQLRRFILSLDRLSESLYERKMGAGMCQQHFGASGIRNAPEAGKAA